MSGPDFTVHIASVCPSERQNFRVSLMDYLSMQDPGTDAGAHLTTANNAIALAQADIVNAFIKHKAAANNFPRAMETGPIIGLPRHHGKSTTKGISR